MARFLKSKKESIGISPDSYLFRGEQKIDFTRLRLIDFNSSNINESEIENVRDIFALKETDTCSWVNIDGLHDESIL
jgi:magnesium transporter